MKRVFIFPVTIIAVLIIGIFIYSCGANPPFAPFNSTITIINPLDDIGIPKEAIEPRQFDALVLDPDGLPLNDVRCKWSLSFAGVNSIIFDTNGDGVGDARLLQLVDPNGCGNLNCLLVPIIQWFGLGAFVDSPFTTLTNNLGVCSVIILINGGVIVDPASLEASTGSGAVDVNEFTVNVQ